MSETAKINLLTTEHGKALMQRIVKEGEYPNKVMVYFNGWAYALQAYPEGGLDEEYGDDRFEDDDEFAPDVDEEEEEEE